jgi:hypothetical protein
MKTVLNSFLFVCLLAQSLAANCQGKNLTSVSVPMILDHNRMIVEAEIKKNNGTWCKVRLWIDSGFPIFYMSEPLARDLGINISEIGNSGLEVRPPSDIRVGGMNLDFDDVKTKVMRQPSWMFSTMHIDANLPSSVLKKYQIIFDYPNQQLSIAQPGSLRPRGISCPIGVNRETGIVQVDAVINGDSLSFAFDIGASYSFISDDRLAKFTDSHPEWSRITGTTGCANMWGWWPPDEQLFTVVRIPEIILGQVQLKDVGIVGIPNIFQGGLTLGEWYSKKTLRLVDGFLGPNAFKAFRVEIDYVNSLMYFEKGGEFDNHDLDIVGLSVRQLADSTYQIVGIAKKDGKTFVDGIEPGDILSGIEDFKTKGATMGNVVDALRGKPGDIRKLRIERNGKHFQIEAKVVHFL